MTPEKYKQYVKVVKITLQLAAAICFYIGLQLNTAHELTALIFLGLIVSLLYDSIVRDREAAKRRSNEAAERAQIAKERSRFEEAQAHPSESLQQGYVRRAVLPPIDVLERANQARSEATAKPESLWVSSLRVYDIGLMAASIKENNATVMVGVLPYIIVKVNASYQHIRFTLFDHLAHTRGQWEQMYKFDNPINLATPPFAIPIPVDEIDERWTLDMRVDGYLFAVYHVNPADIVDNITDVGEITTRLGADGEIDQWSRLAAAKSESDMSLDDLLDTTNATQKRIARK